MSHTHPTSQASKGGPVQDSGPAALPIGGNKTLTPIEAGNEHGDELPIGSSLYELQDVSSALEDVENRAEKVIMHLKQVGSVSAYAVEFKELQLRIDWNDAALRATFERGLKENVKDALVYRDKPKTLQGLIELAVRVDNRI